MLFTLPITERVPKAFHACPVCQLAVAVTIHHMDIATFIRNGLDMAYPQCIVEGNGRLIERKLANSCHMH